MCVCAHVLKIISSKTKKCDTLKGNMGVCFMYEHLQLNMKTMWL